MLQSLNSTSLTATQNTAVLLCNVIPSSTKACANPRANYEDVAGLSENQALTLNPKD